MESSKFHNENRKRQRSKQLSLQMQRRNAFDGGLMWSTNTFLLVFCLTVRLAAAADDAETEKSTAADSTADWKDGWGQKTVAQRHDLSTLGAHMNADYLSKAIRRLTNDELGVPTMQMIFDGLQFDNLRVNITQTVEQVSSRIERSLADVIERLETSEQAVIKSYKTRPLLKRPVIRYNECCLLSRHELTYKPQFNAAVNLSSTCDIVPPYSSSATKHFNAVKSLISGYRRAVRSSVAIGWQYFISAAGHHVEYPAHKLSASYTRCVQLECSRHRSQYLSAALPFPKNVLILVEYGSSLSADQLLRVKAVAGLLIDSFSVDDHVGVAAVADDVLTMQACDRDPPLLPASQSHRIAMRSFVNALQPAGRTNHSLGVSRAYDLLDASQRAAAGYNYILYVSKGLLSSLVEAGQVLRTIARHNRRHEAMPVQINTFAVIDHGKVPLWETQFLKDVADQNFTKYLNSFPDELKEAAKKLRPPRGQMVVVNASECSILTLGRMRRVLAKPDVSPPTSALVVSEVYVPQREHTWSTLMQQRQQQSRPQPQPTVSLSKAVLHDGKLLGVVGTDVNFGSVTAQLTFSPLTHWLHTCVALVDSEGYVLWHNSWPTVELDADRVQLSHVEHWTQKQHKTNEFMQTLRHLRPGRVWSTRMLVERNNRTVGQHYIVRALAHARVFVVVSVPVVKDGGDGEGDERTSPRLTRRGAHYASIRDCTYHRVDLGIDSQLTAYCANLQHAANTDKAGIYLSPAAFHHPFRHTMVGAHSRGTQMGYWAFLSDPNQLIQNTGLRSYIKDEVAALCSMSSEWRRQYGQSGSHSSSILRRFVATLNGVLVSFPAQALRADYDPTQQDWFRKALANPGRIVISAPFLDESGAGYVVTLSHTVYEGKSAAMHLSSDRVVAVMGMHVPVQLLYRLAVDSVPACSKTGTRCLLLDDAAYLIGHSSTPVESPAGSSSSSSGHHQLQWRSQAGAPEPIESQHMTHQEPTLAVTLLQHPLVMHKRLCLRHSDHTLQRYYKLNGSITDALSIQGKEPAGCTYARLIAVPQTNAFLVTIDHNCGQSGLLKSAFCPCNIGGRGCLLCSRVEVSECECPCECSLHAAGTAEQHCSTAEQPHSTMNSTTQLVYAPCELELYRPAERNVYLRRSSSVDGDKAKAAGVDVDGLPPCAHLSDCAKLQGSSVRCQASVGCVWCSHEADGRTPLGQPYCAGMDTCFLGIKGKRIQHYGSGTQHAHDQAVNRYLDANLDIGTPVGPVAGGIMGFFVLTVVAVYCYRHQVHRFVESRTSTGSGARLHVLTSSDDDLNNEYQFDHQGTKPHNGDLLGGQAVDTSLLASFERDTLPRLGGPGHRPPNHRPYRPGPRTESSDHGYSTMTDRNADDSERGTTVEPLIAWQPPPSSKQLQRGGVQLRPTGCSSTVAGSNSNRQSLPPGSLCAASERVELLPSSVAAAAAAKRVHRRSLDDGVASSVVVSASEYSAAEEDDVCVTSDDAADQTLTTTVTSCCPAEPEPTRPQQHTVEAVVHATAAAQ